MLVYGLVEVARLVLVVLCEVPGSVVEVALVVRGFAVRLYSPSRVLPGILEVAQVLRYSLLLAWCHRFLSW